MTLWIPVTSIVILLVIIVLAFGLQQLKLPRKVSFEGIEDDAMVSVYDRVSRWPQFRLIRWFIIRELRKHQPQGILADVGCGPGYLLALIAQKFPHLTLLGIDIADEMLQRAADNLRAKELTEKVSFRTGDIQNLSLPNDSLDFLVSTLSLHHWSEPDLALREIYRVLKPGGQFLIFDLRRDCPYLFYWLICFAQSIIVPSAMRQGNEPINSLLASYTSPEVETFLSMTAFTTHQIKPGVGWMFIWGHK